jgi:hypothetical protein
MILITFFYSTGKETQQRINYGIKLYEVTRNMVNDNLTYENQAHMTAE